MKNKRKLHNSEENCSDVELVDQESVDNLTDSINCLVDNTVINDQILFDAINKFESLNILNDVDDDFDIEIYPHSLFTFENDHSDWNIDSNDEVDVNISHSVKSNDDIYKCIFFQSNGFIKNQCFKMNFNCTHRFFMVPNIFF